MGTAHSRTSRGSRSGAARADVACSKTQCGARRPPCAAKTTDHAMGRSRTAERWKASFSWVCLSESVRAARMRKRAPLEPRTERRRSLFRLLVRFELGAFLVRETNAEHRAAPAVPLLPFGRRTVPNEARAAPRHDNPPSRFAPLARGPVSRSPGGFPRMVSPQATRAKQPRLA